MTVYHLMALIATLFYSLLPAISKKATLGGVDTFLYIGASMVILSVLSFCAAYIKGNGHINFPSLAANGNWIWVVVMGVLNFIAFALMVMSVQKIIVFDYQILIILQPLIGAFLAYLLFKEQLDIKHIIGFAFVCLGLFIAIYKPKVAA